MPLQWKSSCYKKICLYLIHTKGDIVEKQLNLIVKTQEFGKVNFIVLVWFIEPFN